MARTQRAVSVTSAATSILAASPGRSEWSVVNNGSVTVYLGGDATVTTVTGTPLVAGAQAADDRRGVPGQTLYGIVASGTCDVRVMEA